MTFHLIVIYMCSCHSYCVLLYYWNNSQDLRVSDLW